MAARNALYLAHTDAEGDALASQAITVTKPDGSALGVALYEQVSGGVPTAAPMTDSVGLKLLYADYADLDAAAVGRVRVSYADAPATTFDDALWPDPLDLFVDGMTRDRSLAGALTVTGGVTVTNDSATSWTQTIRPENASGRSLNVEGPDGQDVFTVMRVDGNDFIGIGLGDTETYAVSTSRMLMAMTGAQNSIMADFQFTATGGTDSGALRAVFEQHTAGATWARAGEFQSRRTIGDAALWGVEIGTHSSIPVTAVGEHAGIVGAYIANQEAGWLTAATGVRGDSAILIQGDTGWKSSIVARDVDSATVLLRGVSHTTGNDLKGDLIAAGRIYTSNLGATYRIGIINAANAPSGVTDGGIWFDTIASRLALHIGAATGGVAYRPVLLSSEGGNVGVGVDVATLAAQAGLIPTTLQVGTLGTISALKTAGVTTPAANYSSLGPQTDEHWYRRTSAGVSSQLLDTPGTVAVGGGAAATLGTIGGSGPATAAMFAWVPVQLGSTNGWIPIWH